MRYIYLLLICALPLLFVLAGGCADLDLPTGEQEPLSDEAFYAQLASYAGQPADWSEEMHAVAAKALEEMESSGSLTKETLRSLMKEQGLAYETIAAQSVKTDSWPPRHDSTELKETLAQGFSDGNWQGALASRKTGDGGALLLVVTADIADPTVGQLREVAKKIWTLTNAFRRDNGLPSLEWDNTAARIAQAKTEEMYDHDYFDHVSPITGDLEAQFLTFGKIKYKENISVIGENIAKAEGYDTTDLDAEFWMQQWENSPSHKENMLSGDYSHMGAAVYQGEDGRCYAAQEFITYILD